MTDLCPQRLVGGSHLAGDVAGHLGRKFMDTAYLIVAISLQGSLIAHLAMLKSVPTDSVQGITISKARLAQCLELCSIRMQFQLGGDDLFHERGV